MINYHDIIFYYFMYIHIIQIPSYYFHIISYKNIKYASLLKMALCLVKNMKSDVMFDLLYYNIVCAYKGYDKLFCF